MNTVHSNPIGVVTPIVNQQHNIFTRLSPLLNGIPWPTLGSPTKNMLLSPIQRMGMQLPNLEQHNKPVSSFGGKIDDDNLLLDEREKLKIKREKNALASRKCRQNKIRLINHWKDQSDLMEQKLAAKELELEMFKAKLQGLLIYLNRVGVRLPPEFSSDLLYTSPETSVEETPTSNPVVSSTQNESLSTNYLPNVNSAIQISLNTPPTEQMAIASFTEHNKTVKELIDTVRSNGGAPLNCQTHIYALPSGTTSQPISTLISSPVLQPTNNQEQQPTRIGEEGSGNGENDDIGDFEDRPTELQLENTNPLVLGVRTTLLTPTLCMTVDTSSQGSLYNQPTGITPTIINTKIIFSPTTLANFLSRSSP